MNNKTHNVIDYSSLVDEAMHFIVKRSLEIFAQSNFDNDHHFFISFITKYPGVVISEKLHNKYPYEMTIVLQYQFEDLRISENGFSVKLSFDNQKETMVIPFSALTAFADPSVKFGLQFRHIDENSEGSGDVNSKGDCKLSDIKENCGHEHYSNSKDRNTDNVIKLDFKNKKIQ